MTTPYYADDHVTLYHGDCLEVMANLPDESVHAIVTDPPYGLGFMGREWDALPPGEPWARECLRVLKPGGHLLAFGGSRTWHRLAVAVEDAGFEIRDSIAWLYGSGFPKSLDVSKAIDKRPGVMSHPQFGKALRDAMTAKGYTNTFDVAEKVIGRRTGAVANWIKYQFPEAKWWPALRDLLDMDEDTWGPIIAEAERAKTGKHDDGSPIGTFASRLNGTDAPTAKDRRDIAATPDAERWQGWGTALKPSHEPVVVARKPAGPRAILDTIGSQLGALEEACRRRVSGAARSSAPIPAASPGARTATAPDSAATQHEAGQEPTTPTGAAASSSAATVTSASEWAAETFLSTVTSWRECLAEISAATSTSTTSTATSRTTDLKTLSSCLSSIMQSVTAQSTLDPRSWSSLATAADNLFAAGVLNSRSTLALSAIENATASTPHAPQAAGGSSPAFEPVVVARKPLTGTVAGNVLAHGTGALNIDACRTAGVVPQTVQGVSSSPSSYAIPSEPQASQPHDAGRWPTNVLLDGTQAAELDQQIGPVHSQVTDATTKNSGWGVSEGDDRRTWEATKTGADRRADEHGLGPSKFFPTFRYEAKAPTSERPRVDGIAHPTVKPLDLMRWLIRLVTPPGGTVLDPFSGSGTTAEAALHEGFNVITIEREADYLPLIIERINRPITPALDLGELA